MKTVKLFTLGCKVNQYETQALREQFLTAGFRENNFRIADVYLINTCTVTHQADRESRRLVKQASKANPKAKIIVTGCYVEKDAGEILKISDKIKILPKSKGFSLNISDFKGHQRAFIKIQDGCDNYCAYCRVPLVRGRSRSRNLKDINEEVNRLVDCGFKEIVLTGICLGDYHYRNLELADVITSLDRVKGQFRIRLSSIEPQLINDRLIETFSSSKVCPHLHIPLQSGDNQILNRMNRKYSREKYLSLITKVKKKIKDVAITTDVLVGFPGENEHNFSNTLRCLKRIVPLRTHIFPFSLRPGTAAAKFTGRIEPEIIKQRMSLLKEAAADYCYKFRKRFLGRELTVLIESQPDRESGLFCGYSENYIRVQVKAAGKRDVNKIVKAKIEDVGYFRTVGTIH